VENPLEPLTEVEVTDPTHPLFGRSFPLRAITTSGVEPKQVLVAYRGDMTLRIPLTATNLGLAQPTLRTKLSHDAIIDLLTLAEQCEVPCLPTREPSGTACPQTCDKLSTPTSQSSSAR
jgi:hypothetical protein